MKRHYIIVTLVCFILAIIVPLKAEEAIDCGRNFEGIQTPFTFGKYYGSLSSTIWSAGGNGEIGIISPQKDVRVLKLPTTADFNAIFFPNVRIGFVVGTNGEIFKTYNSGQSWVKQIVNTKRELFALSCANEKTCWVVGYEGVILSTKNGGKSWIYSKIDNKNRLFAVHFINERIGWIAGENSLIMKTINGGKTWVVQGNNRMADNAFSFITWRGIRFRNSNFGCIAGNNRIGCTLNGGKNWREKIISDKEESYEFINFVFYKNRIKVLEKCGRDFVSYDFGKTWVRENNSN